MTSSDNRRAVSDALANLPRAVDLLAIRAEEHNREATFPYRGIDARVHFPQDDVVLSTVGRTVIGRHPLRRAHARPDAVLQGMPHARSPQARRSGAPNGSTGSTGRRLSGECHTAFVMRSSSEGRPEVVSRAVDALLGVALC